MARYSRLRQIQRLDPERDYQEIYRLSTEYEFPWDVTRALELALFRTYAVPSIGGLLDRTREFTDRGQKRHDDTVVLLYETTRDGGMDSTRGRAAIRRMCGVLALTDAPLRQALGLGAAPRAMEVAADWGLRTRALLVRLMPSRPEFLPKKPRPRTYRDGYTLGEVGPARACKHAARSR